MQLRQWVLWYSHMQKAKKPFGHTSSTPLHLFSTALRWWFRRCHTLGRSERPSEIHSQTFCFNFYLHDGALLCSSSKHLLVSPHRRPPAVPCRFVRVTWDNHSWNLQPGGFTSSIITKFPTCWKGGRGFARTQSDTTEPCEPRFRTTSKNRIVSENVCLFVERRHLAVLCSLPRARCDSVGWWWVWVGLFHSDGSVPPPVKDCSLGIAASRDELCLGKLCHIVKWVRRRGWSFE